MSFSHRIESILYNKESAAFTRFLIAGGFASAVYYVTAIFLDFLTVMPTMASNTVAYGISVVASYTSQKYWAFRDTSSHGKAFPRFIVSSLLGFGLNSGIVFVLLRSAVPFYIASFAAMAAAAILSYCLQRFFVFTKTKQ